MKSQLAFALILMNAALLVSADDEGFGEAATAIDEAYKALKTNLFKSYYENDYMMCWWNDWESRDVRARLERSYFTGRFSLGKKFLGISTGRWYCCMEHTALRFVSLIEHSGLWRT